jgi:class III poly(R)-hydroxyalkanoic acid synthase PhaE subunit
MAESDGTAKAPEWTAAWIEQQRETLRKSVGDDNQGVEGDQKAQAEPGPANSFDARLKSWRGTWSGAAAAKSTPMGQFSELLERVPAIGPWREHAETWRAVTAAQAEVQKLERELRDVLFRVQNDALDLVQERVRERSSSGADVQQLRDLHKLWVECGEAIFAKVAHSEAYCKLQAEFTNATLRLRAGQQKIIEQWLKQFDLPTRAELNTVHRQLREQKDKLREHKELLAGFVERMKGAKTSRKKVQAKTRKRAAR